MRSSDLSGRGELAILLEHTWVISHEAKSWVTFWEIMHMSCTIIPNNGLLLRRNVNADNALPKQKKGRSAEMDMLKTRDCERLALAQPNS